MQKLIKFNSPSGDEIVNPEIGFLKSIIFEFDPIYWTRNSGDSAITLQNNDEERMLIFFYDEPYGFFFYYESIYVSVQKDIALKDEVVIEHKVGGEPMGVPSICYRTRNEAWEIVLTFIEHGKMSDQFNWVPLGQIDYKWEW